MSKWVSVVTKIAVPVALGVIPGGAAMAPVIAAAIVMAESRGGNGDQKKQMALDAALASPEARAVPLRKLALEDAVGHAIETVVVAANAATSDAAETSPPAKPAPAKAAPKKDKGK